MKLLHNSMFFIGALFLHFGLLCLFASAFYFIYFLSLFISLYLLRRYYSYFSSVVFFIFFVLILSLINLDIYDEYIFEVFLWFDIVNKTIYINSEVMYILIILHLLLLINLKRFENFWAIIDKKLFNRIWY